MNYTTFGPVQERMKESNTNISNILLRWFEEASLNVSSLQLQSTHPLTVLLLQLLLFRMVERHSLITTTVSQDEAIHSFKKTHALTIVSLTLSYDRVHRSSSRSPVRIVLESRLITRHALILKFQQICLNRLFHLSSMQVFRTENNSVSSNAEIT
jgi:hypothetical protein